MKTTMNFLIAVVFVLASSSFVFAGGTVTAAFTDGGKALYGGDSTVATPAEGAGIYIAKTSNGIALSVASNANGYAISTQHQNGTKAFATNFDSTAIYSEDVATVGTIEQQVTKTDTSEFSDWKPL